jgi:hypothetical protein
MFGPVGVRASMTLSMGLRGVLIKGGGHTSSRRLGVVALKELSRGWMKVTLASDPFVPIDRNNAERSTARSPSTPKPLAIA